MRVIELASRCTPERMLEEYEAAYGTTHGHSPASVGEWLRRMAAAVPVRTPMQVLVEAVTDEGGEQYYSVSGRKPGDATKWAVDMAPWEEWREMEVVDPTNRLTTDQLAAHVFFEMTWHGWPEEIEEKKEKLLDTVEQLQRDLASGQPLEELGYTELTPERLEEWLKREADQEDEDGG